jgi:23S rRNA (cytidine1920-2'-O)/16S rRNA (cytidine1409-2'-O)-methyltransferase
MKKVRADQLAVDRQLARTRSQARAMIMAGSIWAGDQRVDKAGQMMAPDQELRLKDRSAYASRGGYKLEGALDDFDLDPTGLWALDVGASTGGFTDCLLQRGAAHVTAVDVGYGLIDQKLRDHPRVRVVERTNARYLTADQASGPFDLAVIDVSFISLALVLPPTAALVRAEGRILALVKPQFEAGPERVGKGGVVRDPEVHREVLDGAAATAQNLGLTELGRTPSKVKGPKGNQEFFLLLGFRSE